MKALKGFEQILHDLQGSLWAAVLRGECKAMRINRKGRHNCGLGRAVVKSGWIQNNFSK